MCETSHVRVMENILHGNDHLAKELQEEWTRTRTFVVNLLSSPGAGKTTLLEATLPALKERYRVLVLEGDIETERDAERIRVLGIEAIQITTGGTCHLDAHMVQQVWQLVRSNSPYDFIFIENIGNLVCPASYALGEHLRVVLLSVPEGDDKVPKYPKAFRSSQVLSITKADLLPYFDFQVERVQREAFELQPKLVTLVLSVTTGQGITEWTRFLEKQREETFRLN